MIGEKHNFFCEKKHSFLNKITWPRLSRLIICISRPIAAYRREGEVSVANARLVYEVEEFKFSWGVEYLFVSEGLEALFKAVEFKYVRRAFGRPVFNLAFGNYDFHTKHILDRDTSGNGDAYMVFNTVLSTIPCFFRHYPQAMIMVRGSDSVNDFVKECRDTCQRRCVDKCRKLDQRIRIYRNFIDRRFAELSEEYDLFGSMNFTLLMKPYVLQEAYKTIFFTKRTINRYEK